MLPRYPRLSAPPDDRAQPPPADPRETAAIVPGLRLADLPARGRPRPWPRLKPGEIPEA
jgi:hypothetical protein